jgi:two-component system, NtrC family, response regulator AtoC
MTSTARSDSTTTGLSEATADVGPLCVFVVAGGTPGRHHVVGTATIGRSGSDATIVLGDRGVSRRHARLVGGPTLTIEDLGSRNGTRVGGRRLAPGAPEPLIAGDVIQIGSATLAVQRVPPTPLPADTPMRAVNALADRVAASPLAVLVVGETGVGKEVLAQRIHARSPRAAAPFLCLNCAALPEALLESELFGHEQGAFTGATRAKPGLFEVARGGTVFLDEIGELPAALQAKLLRVLEARQIQRVGALTPRSIDVRFVAATHRDLRAAIRAGEFREDLYYRLDGITLEVPPLRERRQEVAELVHHFTAEATTRGARRTAPIWTPEAITALEHQPWPGNIRELRNVVERALVLCNDDAITVDHLRDVIGAQMAAAPMDEEAALRLRLAELDRARLETALRSAEGNQSVAARTLKISRNTLIARMKRYGLHPRQNGDEVGHAACDDGRHEAGIRIERIDPETPRRRR